jgi:predicted DNA-binding transcriptional regulator AlpA
MKFLTQEETAQRLNLTQRTLERWRRIGEGPRFVRLGPRRIAYREVDLDAWAEARTYISAADEISRSAA